jgi:hypothetical protein
LHPRRCEPHSVFGTGALLLCQPSEMVRAGRLALPTSRLRTGPSAADITPCGTSGRTSTCIPRVRSSGLFVLSYGSKMAAQAGFAPAPFRLTGGRTTVIPLSKIWSPRQDLHLRSPGPRPGMLLLHYAVLPRLVWEWKPGAWFLWTRGMAAPWNCRRVGEWRPRWDLHPHSSRRQRVAFLFSYEGWWEVLVTLQFVASDLV